MKIDVQLSDAPLVPPSPPFRADCGAVVEFHGVVRGSENGRDITALLYEAYRPMAERLMRAHLEAVLRQHGCLEAIVLHRLGRVPVGEASLYIGVAAPHRREALAAVGEFIDRLKEDVPIWKCGTEPAMV